MTAQLKGGAFTRAAWVPVKVQDTKVSVADAKEYLGWLAMEEKFTDADIAADPDLLDYAEAFAREYTGTFEFMVEMVATYKKWGELKPGQARGVLNCLRADILRERREEERTPGIAQARAELADELAELVYQATQLATEADGAAFGEMMRNFDINYSLALEGKVAPTVEKPQAQPVTTKVADGRYAVTRDGSLHFYQVRSPEKGNWVGFTFVDELTGGPFGLVKYPVKARAYRQEVLDLIASDPDALARFGQELGICGACGAPLTDEESRARGIGPVCIQKLFG